MGKNKGIIMKIVLLTLVLFTAIGCGKISRIFTSWTGEFTYKCSKAGTEYVQSDSGMTILLDKEGKVVPCQE